jgi:hypothetical protein
VSDRVKSRFREAVTIGAAVAGAALGVGVAVAATSPSLVSAPQSADAPAVANGPMSPPPAQVKGYSILRPSSLVMDTPGGLRILNGTGLSITGPPDIEALIEAARAKAEKAASPNGRAHAAPTSPVAAPAPAIAPAPPAEPDFPGLGEDHRSERADPKRSDRAVARAEELDDAPRAREGSDHRGR